MFYGKLPIMILSEMVSGDSDSTNGHLAAYILEHLDELKEASIRDLSSKTHVSISSISRFCRDIGLRDFAELKELIAATSLNFEVCSNSSDPNERKGDYISAVEDSLEYVRRSLDPEKLTQLARDIRKYERVFIFGILKGETAAMNLQSDLAMLGKHAVTKLRFSQQVQLLSETGPGDLVIIFSFTGIIFDYGFPRLTEKKKSQRAKIYFITSDKRAAQSGRFDEVIWFDSRQNQASHPYQLQLVAGLIAQSYAHLLLDGTEQYTAKIREKANGAWGTHIHQKSPAGPFPGKEPVGLSAYKTVISAGYSRCSFLYPHAAVPRRQPASAERPR